MGTGPRKIMGLAVTLLLCAGAAPLPGDVAIDRNLYPAVAQFQERTRLSDYPRAPAAQREWWCDADRVIELSEAKVQEFLLAGAGDRLTVIRLFALMSDQLRGENVAMCGSGDVVNRVIDRLNLHLGLSLPMQNLAVYAWLPQFDPQHPHVAAHLNLIYRKRFIHRFEKEVLPADLKIGIGRVVDYIDNGKPARGFLVSLDFHVSPGRVGFDEIRGVGGRPHGILGVIMDWLSFIPDSVHSMYLENNVLATKALITTRIRNFESTPRYQMHIRTESSS